MTPHQPAAAYWAVAIPGAVAFIAALLAHELAHSLVARRCGVPVTSITLSALGGVSKLGGEPPTARADLLIAAAGPVTSWPSAWSLAGWPWRSGPEAARSSRSPGSAGWR
jgi:Zn-dependent protease